jgi:hypothetical protein
VGKPWAVQASAVSTHAGIRAAYKLVLVGYTFSRLSLYSAHYVLCQEQNAIRMLSSSLVASFEESQCLP